MQKGVQENIKIIVLSASINTLRFLSVISIYQLNSSLGPCLGLFF